MHWGENLELEGAKLTKIYSFWILQDHEGFFSSPQGDHYLQKEEYCIQSYTGLSLKTRYHIFSYNAYVGLQGRCSKVFLLLMLETIQALFLRKYQNQWSLLTLFSSHKAYFKVLCLCAQYQDYVNSLLRSGPER